MNSHGVDCDTESSAPEDDPVYKMAHTNHVWSVYNPNTMMCDFWDGTSVSLELMDNVHSLLDVFWITHIRDQQRTKK